MELLEKEERYFKFVLRKIADILLITFCAAPVLYWRGIHNK